MGLLSALTSWLRAKKRKVLQLALFFQTCNVATQRNFNSCSNLCIHVLSWSRVAPLGCLGDTESLLDAFVTFFFSSWKNHNNIINLRLSFWLLFFFFLVVCAFSAGYRAVRGVGQQREVDRDQLAQGWQVAGDGHCAYGGLFRRAVQVKRPVIHCLWHEWTGTLQNALGALLCRVWGYHLCHWQVCCGGNTSKRFI